MMRLSRENVVTIFGLNYKDNREDAKRWLAEYGGNPYTAIAFDKSGRTGIDWGVYGVPETFILDKKGRIRYKQVGPLYPQIWKEKLLPIIKKLQAE